MPQSIAKPTKAAQDRREQRLLAEQRERRDEPAAQPLERVLLALERQRAGREQEADEHQRHGHRDRDRVVVQRRAVAADHLLADDDRRAHGADHLL
jgi:hypothetical protein